MKQTTRSILCSITASVLFGLSFLFVKTSVGEVSSATLLSWRFLIAAVILTVLALFKVIKVNLRGKPVHRLLLIAFLEPVIYFIGETNGIRLTTASESGAMFAFLPILTMLLSSLVIKELPTKRQLISICLSVGGILIIVASKGLQSQFNALGYAFLFLAMFSDSLCVVLTRKWLEFTGAERTYMMTLVGAVVFTGIALIEHGSAGTLEAYLTLPLTNAAFRTSVLFLGVACSVIAYLCNSYAIRVLGPNRIASLSGVVTVTSILAGVLILGEPFPLLQAVGSLLALAGAYIANKATVEKAQRAAAKHGAAAPRIKHTDNLED